MPRLSDIRIAAVGLASLALAIGVGRFAFTPLLPMMIEDGLIGVAGGGWLAAGHFLGYLAGALTATAVPAAPRRLLQASLLTIGLGALTMGVTENVFLWLALRFAMGVASAWTLTLVSSYAVKRLTASDAAGLQGWVFAGVGGGIAIAGLACLGFMADGTESAAAWRLLGGVSLLAALAVGAAMSDELPMQRPTKATRSDGARTPLSRWAVIAYGTMGFGYIIPATYLPVMAKAEIPDPLAFGWAWPMFGLAAFLSTILAAALWRRYAIRTIWVVGQATMAVGLLTPVVYPHVATVTAAGLAVGGTFMIVTMAGIKDAHAVAAPADVMRHIAALTAAFAAGQMAGPVVAGISYDLSGSFAAPLAVASAALLVTAAPLTRLRPAPAANRPAA